VKAYAWYGVAAALDDRRALGMRERVARALSDAELARARALARDFYQRYGNDD